MQRIWWCAFGISLLGCGSPRDVAPPHISPQAAAAAALAQYDKNSDGRLNAEELEQAPGLRASLPTMDRTQDGLLRADEIADRVKVIIGDEVGLLQFHCHVFLDGRPLEGAEVIATPEKFLGPQFRQAKGTTDALGRADLTMGLENLPGMQCGIFKVEISKKDASGQETLLAKYNRETTLGMEIAMDLPTTERGMKFELKSKPEPEKP